jgi:hypothetical protein
VGAIHHELLAGRVSRAVHVDASTAHLAAAREETERRRHGGRVEFVRGDFVAIAHEMATAEVVTLDRVICCYHDMEPHPANPVEVARRVTPRHAASRTALASPTPAHRSPRIKELLAPL